MSNDTTALGGLAEWQRALHRYMTLFSAARAAAVAEAENHGL